MCVVVGGFGGVCVLPRVKRSYVTYLLSLTSAQKFEEQWAPVFHLVIAEVRDRVFITIDNFHSFINFNDMCEVVGGDWGVCVLPRVKRSYESSLITSSDVRFQGITLTRLNFIILGYNYPRYKSNLNNQSNTKIK